MSVRVSKVRVGDEELIVISRPIPAVESRLTPAELEVAKLVAAGLTNAEISAVRGRSERTIANQIGNILHKLRADSRHQIARVLGALGTETPGKGRAGQR